MKLPSVSFIAFDKRVWLLVLSGVLAILLGFYSIPGTAAILFVSKTGYWFVLASFVLFVRALWRTLGEHMRGLRWRSVDWGSAAIIGLGGLVLLVHETFGFKIIMDEIMLLGTSMSMHFDRTVLTPMRGNDIQGAFVILDGIMDKRPLFFPFLLSLIHDFTGYRPENAFVLNGLLTFVFLGLVNLAGRLLAGRVAGWIAVILFAGLPLLGQNATGGGFELLNLVMILATMLLGVRYLARRDEPAMTAFCLSGLLLAQVRYESTLYLLPVALVVLWVWLGERRVTLSWPVIFAPLLLLPYPLQHRIFELRTSAWQLESKPDYGTPFSLRYVPENLSHAASFFFGNPKNQPSSLVLSILGFVALPFFLLLLAKKVRTLRAESPAFASLAFFTIGFAGQFVLMMAYFWGKFDDPVIRRLSLPTNLWLVLGLVAILPQFPRAAFQRGLLALAVLGLIVSGVPSMAAHAYSQEYLPGREIAWCRQFIADHPRKDYLMIDSNSVLWITHEISATSPVEARRRIDAIAFHMRNHTFSAIYVCQRFNIDPDTGGMTLRDGDDLGPEFVLEPVREERLQVLTLDRISRLVELRPAAKAAVKPDDGSAVVPKDPKKIEKLRRDYLEKFVKELP
ncbi:MAG TPA: hypothetical protein VG710_04335 [Opitutus sp.]|nr:hypothetical protein [Opitutus sp.]